MTLSDRTRLQQHVVAATMAARLLDRLIADLPASDRPAFYAQSARVSVELGMIGILVEFGRYAPEPVPQSLFPVE